MRRSSTQRRGTSPRSGRRPRAARVLQRFSASARRPGCRPRATTTRRLHERETFVSALEHVDTWQLVALASALGWASGVRLYAVLLVTGALGYFGFVTLP